MTNSDFANLAKALETLLAGLNTRDVRNNHKMATADINKEEAEKEVERCLCLLLQSPLLPKTPRPVIETSSPAMAPLRRLNASITQLLKIKESESSQEAGDAACADVEHHLESTIRAISPDHPFLRQKKHKGTENGILCPSSLPVFTSLINI
jgi:hypothetical protein